MHPGSQAPAQDQFRDPVVEAYKSGVDVTLLDRNLRLSFSQRIEQLQNFMAFLAEVKDAGRRSTGRE